MVYKIFFLSMPQPFAYNYLSIYMLNASFNKPFTNEKANL